MTKQFSNCLMRLVLPLCISIVQTKFMSKTCLGKTLVGCYN